MWRSFYFAGADTLVAAWTSSNAVSVRGEVMSGPTIFVIVIILIFVGAMAGLQIYIHSGKDDSAEKREDARK